MRATAAPILGNKTPATIRAGPGERQHIARGVTYRTGRRGNRIRSRRLPAGAVRDLVGYFGKYPRRPPDRPGYTVTIEVTG